MTDEPHIYVIRTRAGQSSYPQLGGGTMATEPRPLIPDPRSTIYYSLFTNHYSLIMQNKPNLPDSQMNVTYFDRKDYEKKSDPTLGENKPNSNPNKPNKMQKKRVKAKTNPIQSQLPGNSKPCLSPPHCRVCQRQRIQNSLFYPSRVFRRENTHKKKAPHNTQGALASVALKRQAGQMPWSAAIPRPAARNRGS